MPPGRKKIITLEVYQNMLNKGLSQGEIAKTLNIDPSAVSRFAAKHKIQNEGGNSPPSNPLPVPASDSIEILLNHSIDIQDQIKEILNEIKTSTGSQKNKNRELLVKLSQENRQIVTSITSIKDRLDDRKVMFDLWQKTMSILKDKLPINLRNEVFDGLKNIRNDYLGVSQFQGVIDE